MFLLGIDIGTSSTKSTIFDVKGKAIACAAHPCFFESTQSGYAEQDPDIWWSATVQSIREAISTSGINKEEIKGVGFSGQMHGLVAVDRNCVPVRKAILHCDVRAKEEAEWLRNEYNGEIEEIVCNPVFPGFQITSLCWMKRHEPEKYDAIRKVMCPKDYVRYRMTGQIGTDHTDASGTLLYDNRRSCWSKTIFGRLQIDQSIVADKICNSYEVAGEVSLAAAKETGLLRGTPVVYGGADQAMHALGNGVFTPGIMMVTIGTSGQVLSVTREPVCNEKRNTHIFRHIEPGVWYKMGAVLFAGSTLSWFRRNFAEDCTFEDLSALAEQVPAGSNGLVFLPCMGGERTPYLDPLARGVFDGVTMMHDRAHFARAIMEGVAFAMKSAMAEVESEQGKNQKLICAGGGVKGRTWAQIQADIYGREVLVSREKEQACLGAAISAGVGVGIFENIEQGCNEMCDLNMQRIAPRESNAALYERVYREIYAQIYNHNAALFRKMAVLYK